MDDELPLDPDAAPSPPGAVTHRSVLAAVAFGGAIGTLARAGAGRLVDPDPNRFPVMTLGVDLLGAFLLGIVLVLLIELVGPAPRLRPFLVTGVLGGFTTFSTFMVEVTQLGRHGHLLTACSYLGVATVGGLALAFAGIALGDAVVARLAPKAGSG